MMTNGIYRYILNNYLNYCMFPDIFKLAQFKRLYDSSYILSNRLYNVFCMVLVSLHVFYASTYILLLGGAYACITDVNVWDLS